MLRIIAGKHKGRIIPSLKEAKCKPSKSKIREAIFSILSSGYFADYNLLLEGSKVLDLFCGTGCLGFEAISRGAGFVTFVDIERVNLEGVKDFSNNIGEEKKTEFLN